MQREIYPTLCNNDIEMIKISVQQSSQISKTPSSSLDMLNAVPVAIRVLASSRVNLSMLDSNRSALREYLEDYLSSTQNNTERIAQMGWLIYLIVV